MDSFTSSAREALFVLLDAAPDAMVVVDASGIIVMANAHAARLFGYEPDALVGLPIETLVPARYRSSHLTHRADYFRAPGARPMGAGADLELYGLRRDHSEFPVEISLSPVESGAGRLAIGAIRDITDRKRADEERVKLARAQAARAEAEQANRLKDEFLAMLAHELRNPLAAIQTGIGVLNRIGNQDPLAARTRGVMNRQLRHLGRLVDDLLDVSRVSTGKIILHREAVDLSALVARCLASVTQASEDQHEITVHTQPALVDVDPMRLEQIVMHLMTNAVKYTAHGGAITVTVDVAGEMAVLVIEDTGVGMTPDLVERVFDLFVQGERSLARSEGGLGIGLTLVKRLVEMHGGSINAESSGPGRGSRFTVRLPTAPGTTVQTHGPPDAMVSTVSSGTRVLVVEDNDDVRDMLRTLLEIDGHEVYEAGDGPSGIDAALSVRPHVAFIDIGLPGLDGYEVVRTVTASYDGVPPKLVALTGYGRVEDRQRIEQAGFHAHLIKPVDPESIRDIVKSARRAS